MGLINPINFKYSSYRFLRRYSFKWFGVLKLKITVGCWNSQNCVLCFTEFQRLKMKSAQTISLNNARKS